MRNTPWRPDGHSNGGAPQPDQLVDQQQHLEIRTNPQYPAKLPDQVKVSGIAPGKMDRYDQSTAASCLLQKRLVPGVFAEGFSRRTSGSARGKDENRVFRMKHLFVQVYSTRVGAVFVYRNDELADPGKCGQNIVGRHPYATVSADEQLHQNKPVYAAGRMVSAQDKVRGIREFPPTANNNRHIEESERLFNNERGFRRAGRTGCNELSKLPLVRHQLQRSSNKSGQQRGSTGILGFQNFADIYLSGQHRVHGAIIVVPTTIVEESHWMIAKSGRYARS